MRSRYRTPNFGIDLFVVAWFVFAALQLTELLRENKIFVLAGGRANPHLALLSYSESHAAFIVFVALTLSFPAIYLLALPKRFSGIAMTRYDQPHRVSDEIGARTQLKAYLFMLLFVALPVALLFGGFEAADWVGVSPQTVRSSNYRVETIPAHEEPGVHARYSVPTTWVLHITLPDEWDHTITYYPRDKPDWLFSHPPIEASYSMSRIFHKAWLLDVRPIS